MDHWHSVSEVSPTVDGYKALVSAQRSNGSIVGGGSNPVTVKTTAIWVQGRWVTGTDGDEVTHWTPLPESPTLAD